MTERGLPTVDGAPACPFVAFEDDREERATSPDHRHRCYAEARPAPRALAHQEAYCLSSAFPVCPTFQDWARREAAQARMTAPGAVQPPPGDAATRNPPRDWSAPPPWNGGPDGPAGLGVGGAPAGGPGGPGRADTLNADDAEAEGADLLAGRSQGQGMGLAGSAADRLATGRGGYGAARVDAAGPGTGPGDGGGGGGGGGGAGGAASRPDDPFGDFEPAYDEHEPGAERPERASGLGGLLGRDRRPRVGDSRRGRAVPPDAAPVWERPRRFEAYPTLKTRMGMPSLSRVALMALVLVVAAVVLFLLPGFLGVGRPAGPAGAGASASPSAGPSVSLAPTPIPVPTPVTYVVAPKDTLGAIAKKFGVTVDQILAVNPQIKDPNKIAIGDVIVIPTTGASASPSPGG